MQKIVNFQTYKIEKKLHMKKCSQTEICSLLNEMLINYDGSIPILELARKFGFKIYSKPLDKSISGRMIITKDSNKKHGSSKVIVVNSTYQKPLQRLIVARELSVYLFKFLKEENFYKQSCTIEDTYTISKEEDVYEEIATNILLPDKNFCPLFLKETRFGRLAKAENNLAKYFKVPKVIIKRKINDLIND